MVDSRIDAVQEQMQVLQRALALRTPVFDAAVVAHGSMALARISRPTTPSLAALWDAIDETLARREEFQKTPLSQSLLLDAHVATLLQQAPTLDTTQLRAQLSKLILGEMPAATAAGDVADSAVQGV